MRFCIAKPPPVDLLLNRQAEVLCNGGILGEDPPKMGLARKLHINQMLHKTTDFEILAWRKEQS